MNPQILPMTNHRCRPAAQRRTAPSDRAPSDRAAFTLVELLLTAALLLALTMVAVPAIADLWKRHRLDQAATDVRLAIAHARIQAIESNTTLRFQCDIGQHTFRIAPASPSAPTANQQNAQPRKSQFASPASSGPQNIGSEHQFRLPGLRARAASHSNFTIWIYPDGTLRGAELWIANREDEIRKLLFDDVTGEIRVQ